MRMLDATRREVREDLLRLGVCGGDREESEITEAAVPVAHKVRRHIPYCYITTRPGEVSSNAVADSTAVYGQISSC